MREGGYLVGGKGISRTLLFHEFLGIGVQILAHDDKLVDRLVEMIVELTMRTYIEDGERGVRRKRNAVLRLCDRH